MKNLTLIKHHPCVQLGHLYEHLFMREVNTLFYAHKLFKHLDYSALGTTYEQGGAIVVDLDLHTESAIALQREIERLKINFGKNNQYVSIETARIIAEESYTLYISDKKKVITLLQEVDGLPWQHIDSLTQLDTKQIRRKSSPIYLTNSRQPKPRQLHLELTLDRIYIQNNPTLAPLFNVIGRIFMLALEFRYATTYGFYGESLSGKPRPLTINQKLIIASQFSQDVDFQHLSTLSNNTRKYVFTQAMIKRLTQSLQQSNYQDNIFSTQRFDRIITETGVLIGSAGWRTIATTKNINDILANTSLTIKFGHQKSTHPLIQK